MQQKVSGLCSKFMFFSSTIHSGLPGWQIASAAVLSSDIIMIFILNSIDDHRKLLYLYAPIEN